MKQKFFPILKIWIPTLLVLAGVLGLAISSRRVLEKNTKEAFNRQQLFLVKGAARGIEASVDNIITTLRVAADALSKSSRETVISSLYKNSRGSMRALFCVDADGKTTDIYPDGASRFMVNLPDLGEALSGQRVRSRGQFMSRILTVQTGEIRELYFVLGVPVSGTSDWLCCIPDFDLIKSRFIYPIRSGQTGYAWVIDRSGILLAHPNKQMEGHKALEVLKELWPERLDLNLEAIINHEMIRGVEGSGEYTGWHIGEKKLTRKLMAYSPINLSGGLWSIGVSAPYREAMAPVMRSIIDPVIFLICFLAVIVFIASLLTFQGHRKRLVKQELSWSQEVFDAITDGISIIDRDYRVLMVNKAVCQWQGKTQAYFKGMPCYQVFQQQEDLCLGCPAREVFETGKPAFRDRVSTTLGGRKYYFRLSAFPLKDKDGNTVKVAECVKDVTEEMALRSELIQHERKSMIVKMSAQVAHEIRNPLGTLTLNVDMLEDEISTYSKADTAEALSLVSIVKSELDGLHRVLLEYLECARFPKIRAEEHDIHVILEDLFSFLEEDLRRKKIVFKTSFEYNLPRAYVDQGQIRRALLNVLLNATEAMDSGGTIEVTTCSEGDWIDVIIADSGPGIDEEPIEKIFTPFFTTKSGGTGLGLSITQHIITEHKGDIYCESKPGEGTTFRIRVPRWDPTREI